MHRIDITAQNCHNEHSHPDRALSSRWETGGGAGGRGRNINQPNFFENGVSVYKEKH